MKRVGIFVDINDMYQCIKAEHGSKLDYKQYYEFFSVLGEVQVATAYGADTGHEGNKFFLNRLHKAGFKTRYQRVLSFQVETDGEPRTVRIYPEWECQITIDAIDAFDTIDFLVLGVSSDKFVPLVNYAKSKGKTVVICAANLKRNLADAACKVMQVPSSMLVK